MFLAFFIPVLLLGGDFIFYWLELVELYIGASHCLYFIGLFMLGGVYFCDSCFKLLIDL